MLAAERHEAERKGRARMSERELQRMEQQWKRRHSKDKPVLLGDNAETADKQSNKRKKKTLWKEISSSLKDNLAPATVSRIVNMEIVKTPQGARIREKLSVRRGKLPLSIVIGPSRSVIQSLACSFAKGGRGVVYIIKADTNYFGFSTKAVSKDKFRWIDGTFDLDLTYITPKVIAMGKPGWSVDLLWRNDINEVAKFFELRGQSFCFVKNNFVCNLTGRSRHYHPGRYLVINLAGDEYDTSKFQNQVLEFSFPDHHTASLPLLWKAVSSIEAWTAADDQNIAAVHCFAGRGRTGLVVSCYLLKTGLMSTSEEALSFFGAMRSKTGYGVVTPSQIRYCKYFELILRGQEESSRQAKEADWKAGSVPEERKLQRRAAALSKSTEQIYTPDRKKKACKKEESKPRRATDQYPAKARPARRHSKTSEHALGKARKHRSSAAAAHESTERERVRRARHRRKHEDLFGEKTKELRATRQHEHDSGDWPKEDVPDVIVAEPRELFLTHIYIRRGAQLFEGDWCPVLKIYNLDHPARRLYTSYKSSGAVHDGSYREMCIHIVADDVILEIDKCLVKGDVQIKAFHYCEGRSEMRKLLAKGKYSKPEKTCMLTRMFPLLCIFRFSFNTNFVDDSERLHCTLSELDSFYSGSADRYEPLFPLGFDVQLLFSSELSPFEAGGLEISSTLGTVPKHILHIAEKLSPAAYHKHTVAQKNIAVKGQKIGESVQQQRVDPEEQPTTTRMWREQMERELTFEQIASRYKKEERALGADMPSIGDELTRIRTDPTLPASEQLKLYEEVKTLWAQLDIAEEADCSPLVMGVSGKRSILRPAPRSRLWNEKKGSRPTVEEVTEMYSE